MTHASLGDFLAELQDHGELVRIAPPVDAALELAAITRHVTESRSNGGPALLFESVKNASMPVVTNLLGNRDRLCRCLGTASLDDVTVELRARLQNGQNSGWLDSLRGLSAAGGLEKWSPKSVRTGACQQIVRMGRDVNLWDLPVPRCWPGESCPVITAGQIVSRHPQTGEAFFFQAPLVVTGQQELAWYESDYEQRNFIRSALATGQNVPVAISLGADPLLNLLGIRSAIPDPRSFAGLWRSSSMEVVRCRTNELEVPAASEIVIEGYLDAAHVQSSEPLSVARGNGRYVSRKLPLIHVSALTHRANPIFPAIVTGPPPSEESWIGLATERILLPSLQHQIPEIVDLHQPVCGAGRNLLFVSIRKTVAHQARRVLHALWGTETLGPSKMIVIVDEDLDVRNEPLIWQTVGTHTCPTRDFLFSDGLSRDDDYTPVTESMASQVGIDATRKSRSETGQDWPDVLQMSVDIVDRIRERWAEYGVESKQ